MSKLSYKEWKKGMEEAPLFFYNVPHCKQDVNEWIREATIRITMDDIQFINWNYTTTYDTSTGTTTLHTQPRTL